MTKKQQAHDLIDWLYNRGCSLADGDDLVDRAAAHRLTAHWCKHYAHPSIADIVLVGSLAAVIGMSAVWFWILVLTGAL